MSGCRIGRVRMKNGGAEVRVLHGPIAENGDNWHGRLVKNARAIADTPTPLKGYAIVALFDDGSYRFASRLATDAPVQNMLWPSWVAEVLRREVITANEVRYVIDNEYFTGGA